MRLKKIFSLNLLILLLLMFAGCSSQQENNDNVADNVPAVNIMDLEIAATTTTSNSNIPEDSSEKDEKDENNEEDVNDAESALKDGFIFIYNGITVYLGEYTERILEELGAALDCYEMESCSFEGIAKTYFYGGFDIETYLKTKNGKDRVYSVALADDSVATAEGVYIGQTFDDMIAAYGTDYTEIPEIPGFYSYSKGGTILSFNLQDDIISSIAYKVADIYS